MKKVKEEKKKTQSMTRTENLKKNKKASVWAQTKAAIAKKKKMLDEI